MRQSKNKKPGKKALARLEHEKAIEKLLAKSRSVLAKEADKALPPVNALPNLKTEPRGAQVSDSIPAGGGYDKDLLHAYKWKQGKQERTETILKIEERRKKVRYSFRKEGKMLDFDPMK